MMTRDETYELMYEFVMDCCHSEQYGHALPAEVVKRAARIKDLIARSGYGQPPPVRCAACDAE